VARGTHERGSALWGSGGGGRKGLLLVVVGLALIAALASAPAQAKDKDKSKGQLSPTALVPQDLYAQALAGPAQLFNVIIQGTKGSKSDKVDSELSLAQKDKPGIARGMYRKFHSISGVAATVSGAQLVALAQSKFVGVITPDMQTTASSKPASNVQIWPEVAQLTAYWPQSAATPGPTIAFLDSGVDASNPAFGGRVQAQENFYSGSNPNAAGDGLAMGRSPPASPPVRTMVTQAARRTQASSSLTCSTTWDPV